MRGVTMTAQDMIKIQGISTHTPHARRDVDKQRFGLSNRDVFQLTRLMRGVTVEKAGSHRGFGISTHTPHARRDL